MSENTKHDYLLKDIDALETQISILKDKCKTAVKKNKELEIILTNARKEKTLLNKKIEDLQNELKKIQNGPDNILNSLNSKEKESLKIKIQDLISKIDYHLAAGSQV